jgi:hypothetical protein
MVAEGIPGLCGSYWTAYCRLYILLIVYHAIRIPGANSVFVDDVRSVWAVKSSRHPRPPSSARFIHSPPLAPRVATSGRPHASATVLLELADSSTRNNVRIEEHIFESFQAVWHRPLRRFRFQLQSNYCTVSHVPVIAHSRRTVRYKAKDEESLCVQVPSHVIPGPSCPRAHRAEHSKGKLFWVVCMDAIRMGLWCAHKAYPQPTLIFVSPSVQSSHLTKK